MQIFITMLISLSSILSYVSAADQLFLCREGKYRQSVWIPESNEPIRGIILDGAHWRYNYDQTIIQEAARQWGFAYATTTSRQGKGLRPIVQGFDRALTRVAEASDRTELPHLPILLMLTQDQTTGGLTKLLLHHYDERLIGIVAHAPTGMRYSRQETAIMASPRASNRWCRADAFQPGT